MLGNHDYTGNALAQQDPAIREVDSRYNSVNKSFIVSAGTTVLRVVLNKSLLLWAKKMLLQRR